MERYNVKEVMHKYAMDNKPSMRFNPNNDLNLQREAAAEKLADLLGLPEKVTNPIPVIEYTRTENPFFDEIRFLVETEPNFFIPAHMLLPKGLLGSGKKAHTVICLQGHTTGMHISLGRYNKFPDDIKYTNESSRYALQAISCGYIAVSMEQRGFGELTGEMENIKRGGCHQPALQAMMVGRTLIGERAFDVGQMIEALSHFDEVDENIGLMGHSGGGTASYYAACVQPKVKIAITSGACCNLYDSIYTRSHCICNYIPRILKYFEIGDLAQLIAPRSLIVIGGKTDPSFPIEGIINEFNVIKSIYDSVDAGDRCHLVVGEGGHTFFFEQAWPIYASELARLNDK